uniref:Uncharacterized protein n=1 Tax=Solanum lycopersicum TaxID=4081 RepID=A0A494G8H3_SOLLC
MPNDVRQRVVPKGDDRITLPNVVRPCVQFKGDDNMPSPTSFDLVCCPSAMMVCNSRRYSIMSMLFKGDDGLQRSTSFDRVFWTMAMMACNNFFQPYMMSKCDDGTPCRRPPSVGAFQGQKWHVTPDIIRPLVLPMATMV